MGQDDLCKVVSENNFITPKQDTENCKTGDYKETDYIKTDNESYDRNDHGLLCVIEKDSDYIDSVFDDEIII